MLRSARHAKILEIISVESCLENVWDTTKHLIDKFQYVEQLGKLEFDKGEVTV